MYVKKSFSIIEVMTVLLIVLLLLSLLIPTFTKLKTNARTALCKGQLRQIGILMNSYASTYDGFLPNDSTYSYSASASQGGARHVGDIPKPKIGNAALYSNWNGHLIPFLDTPLKSYNCETKVTIDGKTRWRDSATGTSGVDTLPKSPFAGGWVVINDAYVKGGYSDLKIFICPEIHGSTVDVRALVKTGVSLPRIHLNTYCGADWFSFDYLSVPVPTTYLANSSYFGYNQGYRPDVNSKRIDQINDVSHKMMLMEGGLAYPSYGEDNGCPYFFAGDAGNIVGRSLAISAYQIGFAKSETHKHRYSFVHDNAQEFWSTYGDTTYASSPYYYFDGNHCSADTAIEFNRRFEGLAYLLPMSAVGAHRGYHLVSFVEPTNKDDGSLNEMGLKYDKFLKDKGVGTRYSKYEYYDGEYNYLTGSANLLFGDGSVSTKDQAWLYNNRTIIATDQDVK